MQVAVRVADADAEPVGALLAVAFSLLVSCLRTLACQVAEPGHERKHLGGMAAVPVACGAAHRALGRFKPSGLGRFDSEPLSNEIQRHREPVRRNAVPRAHHHVA